MKKITIVLIALIAVCLSVSAVSAFDWSFNFGSESNSDGGSIAVDNNKITIQDEKFTIPNGFSENEKSRELSVDSPDFKNAKVTTTTLEDGDKKITFKVIYGDDLGLTLTADPSTGGENKTIGNINGVYTPGEGNATFTYLVDSNKMVQITAPEEGDIEAIFK